MNENEDELRSLHIRLSKKLHKRLKQFAATQERLIKDIVTDAIILYLKSMKSKPNK